MMLPRGDGARPAHPRQFPQSEIQTDKYDASSDASRRGRIKEADMFRIIFRIVLALVALTLPAAARDNGQWENQPTHLRQWFQRLMQPDNPVMSCCGEADAFEADSFEVQGDQYVAIITNGKGVIPEGTKIPVPNNKLKWDDGNPTGHGIIFIGNAGQVYCYVTPGGI
jgi:hypothetical protein